MDGGVGGWGSGWMGEWMDRGVGGRGSGWMGEWVNGGDSVWKYEWTVGG